jgi:inhibitor of cysteine peptidase
MKRLIGIFVLAAIVGSLLVACAPVAEVYTDPAETIEVKVGERFIIALDSNPTTGYTWHEDFDKSFLELVGHEYERSLAGEGLVGAGGTESFDFKALKEGDTEVTMVYKQGWEGGSVGDEYVFKVSIS